MSEVEDQVFSSEEESYDEDMPDDIPERDPCSPNAQLAEACERGYIKDIQLAIEKGGSNWKRAINSASLGGNLEAFLLIANHVDDWDWTLEFACKGGNIDIVNYIIGKDNTNWNSGLIHACESGHIHIVNLMISKGANCWNAGLEFACRGGNIDIVRLMLSKGAKVKDAALSCACEGGNPEIVKLLLTILPKRSIYGGIWNIGLVHACGAGNKEIIELMLMNGADNLSGGAMNACANGHVDILKLVQFESTKRCIPIEWYWSLFAACKNRQNEIIHVLLSYSIDLDKLGLTDSDIEYLCKIGIKQFGKHQQRAEVILNILKQVNDVMNEFLPKELVNVIIEY